MADYVLMEGDMVLFMPTFGSAIVIAPPGELAGSGPSTLGGKKICIEGDEANVEVAGAMYIAAPYLGGTGTLTIDALAGDQVAAHTTVGGTPVMLLGGNFTAKFAVDSKGTDPSTGNQDPMSEYSGEGMFISNNFKVQGT